MLKELGQKCAYIRRLKGKTQVQVAIDTGYSPEVISSFENGRNNNCKIFIWYLRQLTDIEDVKMLTRGLNYDS